MFSNQQKGLTNREGCNRALNYIANVEVIIIKCNTRQGAPDFIKPPKPGGGGEPPKTPCDLALIWKHLQQLGRCLGHPFEHQARLFRRLGEPDNRFV